MNKLLLILFVPLLLFGQNTSRKIWVDSLFHNNGSDTYVNAIEATIAGQEVNIREHLENMNVVNVMDFGAVGDGTTDDATAFQNAVSESKDIIIPDSLVFLINTTINLATDSIKIYGGGTLKNTTGDTIFKQINHGSYVHIDGLNFVGDGIGFAFEATGNPGSEFADYRIENCTFMQDSGVYAISLKNAREGIIEKCYFEDNDGIYMTRTINPEVVNCIFKNTTYAVKFDGDGTSYTAGLRVIGGSALGVDSTLVLKRGDWFDINGFMNDYCDNPVYIEDYDQGIIRGCYMSSRTSAPTIKIYNNGTFQPQNIGIFQNSLISHYTTDSTANIIEIYQAKDIDISHNKIHFYTGYGIYDSSSTYLAISENKIAPRTGYGKYSLYLENDNSTSKIRENRLVDSIYTENGYAKYYDNLGDDSNNKSAAQVEVASQSLNNNGYMFYSGGLQENWGSTGYVTPGSTDTVTFVQKFSTACLNVMLTTWINPDSTAYMYHITTITDSTFLFRFFGNDSATYSYRALGY